jgi:hypothetical protein|tara:strand:+ start:3891 stop:4148 length:258 start_codon:yes stop_codon:yes gene_type:complete
MDSIENKTNFVLTNTKLALTIIAPLIAAIGFFFTLKGGVEENAEDIQKLEAKIERMDSMLIENNTNIKLMQKDITILIEQMKESK